MVVHAAAWDDDASRLELALADIRQTFAEKGVTEIPSRVLVKAMLAMEGRPWREMTKEGKPLTQNKLPRILKTAVDHNEEDRTREKEGRGLYPEAI
jgi:hypothetical protein